MPANPRNSILDDQSIGGKMVSGCKCLMKVHEIIHQEWSPTPSSLWLPCLCKGYKPKTVHSVRERTDRGP